MTKHRTCRSCGSRQAIEVWPKELAIRWLYRHCIELENLGKNIGREKGYRANWYLMGSLFKALGFYAKSVSPMDIPVHQIYREAQRRRDVGGGCWRTEPRPKRTKEGRA